MGATGISPHAITLVGKEAETQRGEVISPGSHSQEGPTVGFAPGGGGTPEFGNFDRSSRLQTQDRLAGLSGRHSMLWDPQN